VLSNTPCFHTGVSIRVFPYGCFHMGVSIRVFPYGCFHTLQYKLSDNTCSKQVQASIRSSNTPATGTVQAVNIYSTAKTGSKQIPMKCSKADLPVCWSNKEQPGSLGQ
jgi:hypothetical protein